MEMTQHCTFCGEDFKLGNWYGCQGGSGRKHVVKSRTFYSDSDRLMVQAIVPTHILDATLGHINIPGLIVTFAGGMYSTTDPEVQEVLERRCPMTKERYMDLRMTPELKAGRQRVVIDEQRGLIGNLEAENQRLREQLAKTNGSAGPQAEEEEPEPVMAAVGKKAPRRRTN